MFKLRWVEKDIQVPVLKHIGITETKTIKILQYRQMSNIEEIGIQPPIWTEWEDVPTEESN